MAHMQREFDELKAQFERLQDQLERFLKEAGSEVGEEIHPRMEAARERFVQTVDTVKRKARDAQEEMQRRAKMADQYAHENPWQVAAGAALLGALLGALSALVWHSKK